MGNFEENARPLPVEGIITKRRGNSTERNQGRRMNAEEKLRIVEEGRSGATVSEVCRRHQIGHVQFHNGRGPPRREFWRRRARG